MNINCEYLEKNMMGKILEPKKVDLRKQLGFCITRNLINTGNLRVGLLEEWNTHGSDELRIYACNGASKNIKVSFRLYL